MALPNRTLRSLTAFGSQHLLLLCSDNDTHRYQLLQLNRQTRQIQSIKLAVSLGYGASFFRTERHVGIQNEKSILILATEGLPRIVDQINLDIGASVVQITALDADRVLCSHHAPNLLQVNLVSKEVVQLGHAEEWDNREANISFVDRNKNIWIGTSRHGVLFHSSQAKPFVVRTCLDSDRCGRRENTMVMGFAQVGSELYVGSWSNGFPSIQALNDWKNITPLRHSGTKTKDGQSQV
ncbi:MAG: hypothetical protein HC842_04760 [Cytophagales bacterium]|nr:hypothetical protein [Cytophagales bacterium]